MIIAGYEYRGQKPFSNVYLTGLVRDQLGRKMSKSLGNSPEPIDLIEKYGADGVRVGMLLCSPAGNDLLYEDNLPEQGRNFANKIWNAFRLVMSWNVDYSIEQPDSSKVAVTWMNEVMKKSIHEIDLNFRKFRISEALMITYKLFWDEFSGWYLEIIKPEYQKPVDIVTYKATLAIFDNLLKLIHPFMPFISEDIWQLLEKRNDGDSIMITRMPESKKFNKELVGRFDVVKETISAIRTVRKNKNIPYKEQIELLVRSEKDSFDIDFIPVIRKLCNLSELSFVSDKPAGAVSFMVRTTEFFIHFGGNRDIEGELTKIQEDLDYNRGFLVSVIEKLDNERFVANAPTNVLELEKRKKSDAESKIKSLEERLKELQSL
jgi:valyl-tRNA synthetase